MTTMPPAPEKTPPQTCWSAMFIDMHTPRSAGAATDNVRAPAEIMRDAFAENMWAFQTTTMDKDVAPDKFAQVTNNTDASREPQVKRMNVPVRSASLPASGPIKIVTMPVAM